jgi:DNA polymerase V
MQSFDAKTDHRLLYRRLGINADGIHKDDGYYQMDFFIDYAALTREKKLQGAVADIRSRFGRNALFTGKNLLKGATQLERNAQIGGHRA